MAMRYEDLSPEQLSPYRQTFALFDSDGDGKITAKELRPIFDRVGFSATEEELNDLIHEFDEDNDGAINFVEFVQMMLKRSSMSQEEKDNDLKETFQLLDMDGKGFIAKEDFKKALSLLGEGGVTDDSVNDMLREIGAEDKGGRIDWSDFRNLMQSSGQITTRRNK